ncbi:hypothetical protein [uncultured Methanobrevibacter sp.]|uniref:hypothetical protein n=1 Tax=uncultured Methanobrevibacter sp. TaxID=253161 RepID=UPI00263428F9|nr:hypothetical protein [uncultured Methanobrevibacter sp.]
MLNIEQLILDLYGQKESSAIVDGIYFTFNKKNKLSLFFIEFKGDKLDKKPLKKFFKENICTLKENACEIQRGDCPISNLNQNNIKKIYTHYEDEMAVQLKIKPLETILIAIPTLFREFKGSTDKLNSFLTEHYACHVYIVYANDANSSNTHMTVKQEIENKYSLYQKNGIITDYQPIPNDDFIDNFIPKINLFPIHYLNNILDIVDDLNEISLCEKDIDKEIDKKIESEINTEGMPINQNQKKKLHKVIYHLCN